MPLTVEIVDAHEGLLTRISYCDMLGIGIGISMYVDWSMAEGEVS
jgi:hypothetical protein